MIVKSKAIRLARGVGPWAGQCADLPEKLDTDCDVLAIVSGAGGLCAAITAHEYGQSALVIEKSGQVGGVTALSMGDAAPLGV